jgi:hypothetical protein
MAITVVPGSTSFVVTQRPIPAKPSVVGPDMTFTCQQNLTASGRCTITGAAGDNPAGWTLGLIQLQWIETNWGNYRGQGEGDGSCFLQRARPPARASQACRDTLAVGGIFVDNNPGGDRTVAGAGRPFPIGMTAVFSDGPNDTYPLTRVNSLTGKTNFLQEVQLEFHFCTILTLMDPTGVFKHLSFIYWNVHWQAAFLPTDFSNIAAPWTITLTGSHIDNSANVGAAGNGAPGDPRFSGIITVAGAPNCNAVATAAANTPNTRESRNKWENFVVGR